MDSRTIWTAILSVTFFLTQVRLDPDPHHDGIIFVSGLAFSEGLLPNKDFFSQYGPIHVAVSGWNLEAFGQKVLSLRILTAILLAIVTTLMFILIRQRKSDYFALGVCAYWCLSCPTFILAATTPWPSVLTTVISLVIILVIGDGSKNQILLSLLVCLGTLCRIQYSAVGALILCVVIFKNWRTNRIIVIKWSLALTANFFFVVILLGILGILPEYFNETIIWAFGTYGTDPITLDSAGVVKLMDLLWIPFTTLLAYLLFSYLSVRKYVLFILFALILVTTSNILFSFEIVKAPRSSFHSFVFLLEYVTRNIVGSGLFLALGIVVFQLIKSFRSLFKSALQTQELLRLSIAGAAVLQLFPQWDLMHIWWISPILLVLTSWWLVEKSKLIVGALIFLVVLGGIQTAGYMLEPRSAYRDSILSGMVGKQQIVDSVGKSLLQLETLDYSKKVRFNCDHAIYAGFGGAYHSSSHSYVNWGAGYLQSNQIAQGTFYCNVMSESPILNLVKSNIDNFAIKMPDGSWNVFIIELKDQFLD